MRSSTFKCMCELTRKEIRICICMCKLTQKKKNNNLKNQCDYANADVLILQPKINFKYLRKKHRYECKCKNVWNNAYHVGVCIQIGIIEKDKGHLTPTKKIIIDLV